DAFINPSGGFWDVAGNWSTGQVPGPADDVALETDTGAAVTLRTGTVTVHSLIADSPLTISGGASLTATAGLQASRPVSLGNGSIVNTVITEAPGTALSVAGGTLDGVTLEGDAQLNSNSLTVRHGLTLDGTLTL